LGKIRWYKRDPDAALSGMMGLTLEERGAYNTVLDLLYSRAGNLPDDDRFICGWLRCDPRIWRRIKQRLVDLKKLVIESGQITNYRATSEITMALHRLEDAAEAGRSSARRRACVSKENNDIAPTTVEKTDQLTTTTTTTRIIKKRNGTQVLKGLIDFSDPENRNAFADNKVAAVLGWDVVIAARDPSAEGHAKAREAALRVSQSLSVRWEAH
jgi:uncharacterized protein YdaU (DUF1376 family)